MEKVSSSNLSLPFNDFLNKMRNPASLDLIRSIKSFIVSFSFSTPNMEDDGKRIQEFFSQMGDVIRDHTLWANATEEEIECALEKRVCQKAIRRRLRLFATFMSKLKIGNINVIHTFKGLEKYVMTKLFSRSFAAYPEDRKFDHEISEKISLLQEFLRHEHFDIPTMFHNEASWLIAEKELQKINTYRAPREKLLCILNCCRVINNSLLNASMSEKWVPGADNFLPILIYVTIKANPPQLHSNLKFIQLYRKEEKLVSETAYYLTSLISAKSFIVDLDAKSLSMDEAEFCKSMQAAKLSIREMQNKQSYSSDKLAALSDTRRIHSKLKLMDLSTPAEKIADIAGQTGRKPLPLYGFPNMTGGSNYPFMDVEAGEMTAEHVARLLSLYKDVVKKYTSLCMAIENVSVSSPLHESNTVVQDREDRTR